MDADSNTLLPDGQCRGEQLDTDASHMPMTPWTLVCKAQDATESSAFSALSQLCQMYWYPVYAFARRWGCSPQDAEDTTQEFFMKLLSKDYLSAVSKDKGRLRSFLRKSMRNHLLNWKRLNRAERRGGGRIVISIDQEAAEARYRLEPVDQLTADVVYDRYWALTVMKHARERLETEYRAKNKEDLFQALKGSISTSVENESYSEIANRLGTKEDSVKQSARRLRVRFKELLQEVIAETTEIPEEVDDEVRYLLRVFQ